MAIEFTTPVGRIVQGHPMKPSAVKDDDGKPVFRDDGTPKTATYFAIAIPKNGTTDFKQTDWGQKIDTQAKADWPNGMWQQPSFAWKVDDGDSTVPNKAGRIPNQQEGWAGCWILKCKTYLIGMPVCYHVGKYHPTQAIQNADEIKCGDYVRVLVSVEGNKADTTKRQTAGLYINPELVSLDRAGVQIFRNDTPDANAAFGDSAPQLPPDAAVDTGVAPDHGFAETARTGAVAPPPPTSKPAGPVMLPAAGGVPYESYKASGWTDEQLIANGFMQG